PVEPALFEDTRFFEELIGLWCEKGAIDPASLDSRAKSWWARAVKEGHLSGNGWDGPAYGDLLARGGKLLERLNGYDRTLWEGSVLRERIFEAEAGENREGDTWYLKSPVLDTSYGEIRLTGTTGSLMGSEILSSATYLFGKKARTKDLFAPFLSHLIMAVREDEGYYGRQVLLAGEEGDRLAGWTSRSGQRADHFRLVPEPRKTLILLAELYLDNLGNPLPFYPSLLDSASENLEKQKWEATDLPREWPRLWQGNLSGMWGAFDINSCPYREMLMPETPEWDKRLEKLFTQVLPYLR
ncbi:MAG: hypothetical protein JXA95_12645, partial [Spirochaetales bacterium]|nr:hypothetical protein [Spirochaetales bacterium]